MPLTNCKVKSKLKWIKDCVLSVTGNDNTNGNPDHVIFTIKDTKLYVPVVTLSAKDNEKLSKRFSKVFERSVYCNEYKTKSKNKNTTNKYRYFLESDFVEINRLFILVYTNQNVNSKWFKTWRYHLPKEKLQWHHQWKNLYDQAIDSDITWYKEIRNFTARQGEDYTTGFLLDYDYIKNHYKLIAVDLSGQKSYMLIQNQ